MAHERSANPAATTGLLLLFAVSLVVAQVAFYADRNLFDADRFADHVESALQQPDVRREAGAALSREVLQADPDLIALEPIVRAASESVVGSSAFRSIVRGAAYKAHIAVFSKGEDSFALTVAGAGLLVVQVLETRDPEAAGKVPEGLKAKLTSLSDGDFGQAFTDLAQLAQDLRVLGWIALALALLSLVLLLAPSQSRRARVRSVGLALAGVGVLAAIALEVAKAIVSGRAPTDQAEAAVRGIWDEFLGGLLIFNVALAAAGLVLAAVADSRLRALSPLERVRDLVTGLVAPPSRPWLRALRAAALAAVGIFLVVNPDAAVRLAAAAVGLLAVAVAADEVIAMTAAPAGPEPERARRRIDLRRPALVVLCLLALAAPVVAIAAKDGPGSELAGDTCNGSAALCDRPLDRVAFAATHNSMSSPGSDFLFPDQQSGIPKQLEGGIRGLLIDTHMGVKTDKGVYTLLQAGGKSREKLEQSVGEDATRTAERLRARIGFRGRGDAKPYLCHGFCELGAIPAEDALRDVRDFLVANPGEVQVISIEDQITPEQTKAVFERSGLLDLVWTDTITPFPTLGEMVERDRRVVVFGEEDTQGVPWYHQQFDFVKETPFEVPTAAELLSPAFCELNRGKLSNPIVLLNHWVAQFPPRPSTARKVNGARQIARRARRCAETLRGSPGLLAVDLWETGDVVGAARSLNRGVGR